MVLVFRKKDYTFDLFKTAVSNWWKRDPFTQSAAVAYYTIFSFPALIILYFATASAFLDEAQLQQQVFGYLQKSFGEDAASRFQTIIQQTAPQETGFWPFAIAGSILVYAALRLFIQLQKALNYIWDVDDNQLSGFKGLIIRRIISFAVMVGVLFGLAVSLVLTSSISTMTAWLIQHLPDAFVLLVHGLNLCFSLIIISLLFAVILKKLPDIDLTWQNVYPGALIAAALFMLGEYLLGIYVGTARPASAYGVTGSVILLMIWVSYSCSILLLGAEYSKVLRQLKSTD
ncbi:MAG: YihY/virulence factor BrkB family protein [Alphaproteobacteria bacterium]